MLEQADGRRLRRDRNRSAVVAALLSLIHDGHLQPGAEQIAERAGISQRSIFRYFVDIDDLCETAVTAHVEAVAHLEAVSAPRSAGRPERVRTLVAGRIELYEALGAIGLVVRLKAPFQDLIAQQLRETRAARRRVVAELLAPELAAVEQHQGAVLLTAVDTLCSWEAHHLLRTDRQFEVAEVEQHLVDAVLLLLASVPGR